MAKNATRIRIRVDGRVMFNGSLKQWATKPPDLFKEAIKPDVKTDPWMRPAMVAMHEAVITETSIDIDVTTSSTGYILEVKDK